MVMFRNKISDVFLAFSKTKYYQMLTLQNHHFDSNFQISPLATSCKSLVKSMNNKGPRIEPCGM